MKFKQLLIGIDSNVGLNIMSEEGHWLYSNKVVFITSDLCERTVKTCVKIKKRIFYYCGGLINGYN